MVKFRGWLLDVYPNYEFNYMTSWLKLENEAGAGCKPGAEQLSEPFDPSFYVHGTKPRLRELVRKLKGYSEIKHLELGQWRIDIADPKVYDVLQITMRDYRELKPCAAMIDREGKYAEFQLFNVDLRLSQMYMFSRGVFPLAHVEVGRKLALYDDDQFSLEYQVPELVGVDLEIKVDWLGSSAPMVTPGGFTSTRAILPTCISGLPAKPVRV